MLMLAGSSQNDSGQQFTRVEMPRDFPNYSINSTVRDQQGLLWIGTNDGLCRYDSPERVKIFKANNEEYPSGLLSNTITKILPDGKANLWIGTKLGGLTKYNQVTDTWTSYKHDQNDPSSISNNDILSLMLDSQGRIWIGTENGLNIYVDSLDSFISFLPDPKDDQSLNAKAVLSISEDNKGWIWATTWAGGLHLVLPDENGRIENSKFKVILPSDDDSKNSMWSIFNDQEDRYWIALQSDGLALMQLPPEANNSRDKQDWQPNFHYYTNSHTNYSSLTNDFVLDIVQDKKGDLWVCTVSGLNRVVKANLPNRSIYNSVTSKKPPIEFEQNFYSPANQRSLSSNYIKSIYEDEQGLIWIGTEVGLNMFNPKANQFTSRFISFGDYPTVENEAMVNLNDSILILNINMGDVIYYDIYNNTISENSLYPTISDATSMIIDKEGDNVFFTRLSGISRLSLEDYKLTDFKVPNRLGELLSIRSRKSIFKDSKNRMWIGTSDGLFVYSLDNNSVQQVYADALIDNSLTDNSVSDILEDSKGNIWIGTFNGLNKLISVDGDRYSFKQYLYDDARHNESLPFNTIIDIEELDGQLYLGSESGFFSMNIETEQFTNITKNKTKYTIRSIQTTQNGNIWASTSDGIVVYYPNTNSFVEYKNEDGVGNNGFLRRSKNRSDNGVIYFGGRTGFTEFNPIEFVTNSLNPDVHVTEILEMNQNQKNEYKVSYADDITFGYDTYYISISFSSTNYNREHQNNFSYRLEGFTDEWTYTNLTTPIPYTNLDPGEYTFRVRTSNSDGQWIERGDSFLITIKPAFWQTWWFKLLTFFALCFFVWWFIHLYTRNIKQVNEKLSSYNENLNIEIKERKRAEKALQEREQYMEQLVDERTKELSVKNEKVKSLLGQLEIRNDELEQIVKKRTANLTQANQELVRSNKDLEQFAYISSHDLKEPLRTVGTFTSLLNKKFEKSLDPKAKEYLTYIIEGVHRMSELIQSLLSYSTVGNKDIELQSINLSELLEDILKDFTSMIADKNVILTKDKLPIIVCDKIQMGMVFRNLITNAIKFNDKKQPRIHIGMTKVDNDFWCFYVKDNGIGIEPDYQNQIFELFKRLHRKDEYDGTGIGLAMCQKVIIRHQGTLSVSSTKNVGSIFQFSVKKDLNSSYAKM